jgi:FixJ family two-component response regulator
MSTRVLIVDDEQGVLDGYERLLRREFELTVALGGDAGLEAIHKFGPFAVVISDMRMPAMNGADFLAEVKKISPDTVRMLLTGYTDMNAAMEAIKKGHIFRLMTKPSTKEVLVEAIQAGLEEYQRLTRDREAVKRAQDFTQSISNWEQKDTCNWDNYEGPTGLPGPTQVREYLAPLIGVDQRCCVVMLRLTALTTIEHRYGEEAASGYLNVATQYLMQSLENEDRLFHWDRDILLAVVRRSMSPAAMRMEIARMTSASKEHMMDLNGRIIMISSPITFDIQSICKYQTLEKMFAAFNSVFLTKDL